MTINKKHTDLTEMNFEDFCDNFGVDYQVLSIKSKLIKSKYYEPKLKKIFFLLDENLKLLVEDILYPGVCKFR